MSIAAPIYLNALFLLLGDNSERTKTLVGEFLAVGEKHGNKKEFITTEDDDLIGVYKWLIKSALNENITQENQTASKMLLLKLSSNEVIKSHPLQRDLLTDVLTMRDPITAEQIDEYLKTIRNTILVAETDAHMRKLYAKSRGLADLQDPDQQAEEIGNLKALIQDSFTAIETRESGYGAKASESYVSLSDPESIKRSLDRYIERAVTGVIKSGLQGLNRSLGERGGIGRGEAAVFAAPSHHFKSGMLVLWMLWAVVYNTFIVAPGKKPLVYFVSLENEVHQNIMFVFKTLYARVERKKVDITKIGVDAATKWIIDYFAQFGIDVIIDRFNPYEFTFSRFTQRYNSFVEMGYELVLFDLDYMSEAKGADPSNRMNAEGGRQLIAENYIKFCSHAKQSGYALVTGHQTNRKADELVGSRLAVKKFDNSMIADSSDVFRPVDIFFFMAIEFNMDGNKFLTVINKKNRGNQDTPDKHKFFAYPFTEFGIEDDIGMLPGYVTDLDAFGNDGNRSNDNTDNSLF